MVWRKYPLVWLVEAGVELEDGAAGEGVAEAPPPMVLRLSSGQKLSR
jgi:hypothetical protein